MSWSVSIIRCHIKRHLTELSKRMPFSCALRACNQLNSNRNTHGRMHYICNGNLFWHTSCEKRVLSMDMQTTTSTTSKVMNILFFFLSVDIEHTWSKYMALSFSHKFFKSDGNFGWWRRCPHSTHQIVYQNAPFVHHSFEICSITFLSFFRSSFHQFSARLINIH